MWRRFTFYSEGCAGQNKNNTVIRYLCSLIYARKFAKVVQVILFCGHSFLPCDRDFGLIKRVTKKADRTYSVEEYTDMMVQARAHTLWLWSQQTSLTSKTGGPSSTRNYQQAWTSRSGRLQGTRSWYILPILVVQWLVRVHRWTYQHPVWPCEKCSNSS